MNLRQQLSERFINAFLADWEQHVADDRFFYHKFGISLNNRMY